MYNIHVNFDLQTSSKRDHSIFFLQFQIDDEREYIQKVSREDNSSKLKITIWYKNLIILKSFSQIMLLFDRGMYLFLLHLIILGVMKQGHVLWKFYDT